MRYARIYPWRRTRRFRAPSNGPEAFFVAQFSAGYTTNMFGFDLRQGQPRGADFARVFCILLAFTARVFSTVVLPSEIRVNSSARDWPRSKVARTAILL